MTTRSTPETAITYIDLQPSFDWIREEGRDTLRLFLPGFKKENIRGQLDPRGNLKIDGKRPLSKNKWTRFEREFLIPEHCNQDEISAKIDNGILYVTMPKLITPANLTETSRPNTESYGKHDNDYNTRIPTDKSQEKLTLKEEIDKKYRAPKIGKDDKHIENENSKGIKEKTERRLASKIAFRECFSSEDREKWKMLKAIDTESRKLVLNMAVSSLVLVAFGLHVYLKFESRRRKDGE